MFGTSQEDATIVHEDPDVLSHNWQKKRLLLYAHGGLVSEVNAVQRVAEERKTLLKASVYPVSFIWNSDLWTTWKNILDDAMRRRKPEGLLDRRRISCSTGLTIRWSRSHARLANRSGAR